MSDSVQVTNAPDCDQNFRRLYLQILGLVEVVTSERNGYQGFKY